MTEAGGGGSRPEGRFKRAVKRLASNDDTLEADQLQQQAASQGATAVSACEDRRRVTVMGTVRSLTLRPRAGAPSLEVELYDGSGTVTLVWLGRRELAGLTPGRRLRVSGRITTNGDRRVIFNPRYEFVPGS
jgi:RecG-like helicase